MTCVLLTARIWCAHEWGSLKYPNDVWKWGTWRVHPKCLIEFPDEFSQMGLYSRGIIRYLVVLFNMYSANPCCRLCFELKIWIFGNWKLWVKSGLRSYDRAIGIVIMATWSWLYVPRSWNWGWFFAYAKKSRTLNFCPKTTKKLSNEL